MRSLVFVEIIRRGHTRRDVKTVLKCLRGDLTKACHKDFHRKKKERNFSLSSSSDKLSSETLSTGFDGFIFSAYV